MSITVLKTVKNTSYNSTNNTRYVYETTYYFDDVLDKKFSKRRVVGKIDPDTGMEIETGPVGRPKKEVPLPKNSEGSVAMNSSQDLVIEAENEANHIAGLGVDDMRALSSTLANLADDFVKLKELVDKMICQTSDFNQ